MRTAFRFGFALVLAALSPAMSTGCAVDAVGENTEDATQAKGRFEIFKGEDGQFYFHLLAGNGEKVLRSEGYTTLAKAKKGVQSVVSNGKTKAKYKLLAAQDGEHYFNLVATNGQVVGTSETYTTKGSAKNAIVAVTKLLESVSTANLASGVAKFEVFEGSDSKFYFRLRAKNGQIVLQSQGYADKAGAQAGTDAVKANGAHAESYQILEGKNEQHYFRIISGNNEVVGRGEMYVSKYNAQRGAETMRKIIRQMTDVAANDADVQAAIELAADGASYTSESDYGYSFVHATMSSPDAPITVELLRETMAPFVDGDPDTDKPLADLFAMEGSWEEWITSSSSCEDEDDDFYQELCVEQAELDAVLDANLTDIKVYYFGRYGSEDHVDGVAVSIIIIGRTASGNLAGVRTIAIWT